MSFSIWLVPEEASVRSYLQATVNNLAQKYDGPQFEPHSTLLGDIPLSIDEMSQKCKQLADQIKPFVVETGTVEYSTTYYQCVFVRLKPTPDLMNLYDAAKRIFGKTEPSVYMPHISLFYGNVPYTKRQEIIESFSFQPQHYSINSLIITPGGEHPPAEWEHLYELSFTG